MSIAHADVWVECDECGHTEAFESTHVSSDGRVDMPTLHQYLEAEGWWVEYPSRHVCPDCNGLEDEEEDDEDEDNWDEEEEDAEDEEE